MGWGSRIADPFFEEAPRGRAKGADAPQPPSGGRAAVGLPALAESHARPDQEILEIARLAKMNVGFELFALNLLDLRNVARFAQSDELFFAQVEHKMGAADLAAIQITHFHPFVARRAGCPERSIMPANSRSLGRTRAKQDARCKAQEPLRFCSRKKKAAGTAPLLRAGHCGAVASNKGRVVCFLDADLFPSPLFCSFCAKRPNGRAHHQL